MPRQLIDSAEPADPRDPRLSALDRLRRAEPDRPRLLLHAGRPHRRWARRCLLATPRAWFRHTADGRSELIDAATGRPLPAARRLRHRLWADLRRLLNDPAMPGPWIGYISYEAGRTLEPAKLTRRRPTERPWPLVELGWCPEAESLPAERADRRTPPPLPSAGPQSGVHSDFTRAEYEAAVRRVLDYIAAGDAFQVNLAQRLTAGYTGDPRRLFERLATISPAWYGAYLELPPETAADPRGKQAGSNGGQGGGIGRAICSTSPELFLELSGRDVVTRPIKGTRPATADAAELRDSEKDTAELNMIVDLMRNDLGRVCEYGSVRVASPRTIESHPTIHHGVATVAGRLHPSKDVVDLLKAAFPGGSVTGAPKVRAMQIIDELEPHARGPYCGCIGYLTKDEACFNIAIRTMMLSPEAAEPADRTGATGSLSASAETSGEAERHWTVDLPVGGGIVADSDPAAEHAETLDKARAMLTALGIDDPDTGDKPAG